MSKPELKSSRTDLAAWLVLSTCGSEWTSAIQAAERARLKYRPLAFGLRRLARAGYVEERIVTYKGTARSKEERREYRLAQCAEVAFNPFLPQVKAPPKGAARRVRGRDMRDDEGTPARRRR